MRIRVRVPSEDKKEPGWFLRWWQGYGGDQLRPVTPAAVARKPLPVLDKRWAARGEARYFYRGRLCVRPEGAWQCEYLFDVLADDDVQPVRIVLREPDVSFWETARNQRMPEAKRLGLAKATLEGLIDLHRFPSAMTISRATVVDSD